MRRDEPFKIIRFLNTPQRLGITRHGMVMLTVARNKTALLLGESLTESLRERGGEEERAVDGEKLMFFKWRCLES